MVVINNCGRELLIPELMKKIPADGQRYELPDHIAYKYRSFLIFVDIIAEKDNLIQQLQNGVEIFKKAYKEQKEEADYYKDQNKEIILYNQNICKTFFLNVKFKEIKPLDFIYIFQFKKEEINSAIKRLHLSIKSIINQNVNVKLCNISTEDIKNEIKDYNLDYIFISNKFEIHNKSLVINTAVKKLVKTEYFFISDIDLIYPSTFVKYMSVFTYLKTDKPFRVSFYNYNLGTDNCNTDFKNLKEIFEKTIDNNRSRSGVAIGNGLIHKPSFDLIKGFDERYEGYGPEDQDFNYRIKFINNYIVIDLPEVNTYHIYHPICKIYGKNNDKLFMSVKNFLNNKNDCDINLLKAGSIPI